MKSCKDFSIITTPTSSSDVEIIGIDPIQVQKNVLGSTTRYTIKTKQVDPQKGKDGIDGSNATIEIGSVSTGSNPSVTNSGTLTNAILDFVLVKGKDGEPGQSIKGDPGTSPTIKIGDVQAADYASVTNSGTATDLILDFTIPKGDKGEQGPAGVAQGLSNYLLAVGNNSGIYSPMGNFNQGTFIDLGDNPYSIVKKIRIRAWVTVANMQNWTTLKLTSGNQATYNGSNLLSQRVKHSEGQLYVGQYEISKYVETSDQYIGFTFADAPGGNYSSDGAQYGDYGIEVFILP